MSKLTAITSDFARAIEHLGTEHFVPTIADVLCGLVNADDATVIVYGHEELPTISFARPLAGKEESSLATYLTGPFLLDPFYRAAAYDQQFGVFRLADLAPASFRSSEYYKNWYKHCGYEDECGYSSVLPTRTLSISLLVLRPKEPVSGLGKQSYSRVFTS